MAMKGSPAILPVLALAGLLPLGAWMLFGPRRWRPRYSLRTLVILPLFVTSAFGLWWHWEAWAQAASTSMANTTIGSVGFDSRSIEVKGWVHEDHDGPKVFRWVLDEGGLRPIGKEEIDFEEANVGPYPTRENNFSFVSPGGSRLLKLYFRGEAPSPFSDYEYFSGCDGAFITDAATGRVLAEIGLESGQGNLPAECYQAAFCNDAKRLVMTEPCGPEGARPMMIRLYRRRRPEWWWWVFYLKEFWLTAAFAGLLVWSVMRDKGTVNR